MIREVRDGGLEVFVWTINDPEEAGKLLDMGVTGVTTDRPAWLRGELSERAQMAHSDELLPIGYQ